MRIISSHHDYYDCIQAYGQDQTFMYIRKPELVCLDSFPFPKLRHYNNYVPHHEYVIGFCGKVYPVIVISDDDNDTYAKRVEAYCYNTESVDEFIEKYYKKKIVKEYYSSKRNWRYFGGFTHNMIKEYFQKFEDQRDNYEKMFRDSGHPLFVCCSWTNIDYKYQLTYNASLKEVKFYKVFPTAEAYQEISMYLGGVLGQNNPTIPEISNKDMIEAKGFDLKTSFRKEKSK